MGGYFSRCDANNTNTNECFICEVDIDRVYDIIYVCTVCKMNIHHKCFTKILKKDETICPQCKNVNTIHTTLDV
jgi:hypothetical protein